MPFQGRGPGDCCLVICRSFPVGSLVAVLRVSSQAVPLKHTWVTTLTSCSPTLWPPERAHSTPSSSAFAAFTPSLRAKMIAISKKT